MIVVKSAVTIIRLLVNKVWSVWHCPYLFISYMLWWLHSHHCGSHHLYEKRFI